VLSLLDRLQHERSLTYLMISHDLHTISAHCDHVAVMYLGAIVEIGPARQVFEDPQHPYRQALLSASLPADPTVHVDRFVLRSEIPSSIQLPGGCFFATRCPLARADCLPDRPASRTASSDHLTACVRLDDGTNRMRSAEQVSAGSRLVGRVAAGREGLAW
jgi:oligopeptide/dipeptide ABC transporter ATP-binding protein